MKQGESKKLLPKDKHLKESWKRRDAARKGLQELHLAAKEKIEEARDVAAIRAGEQV